MQETPPVHREPGGPSAHAHALAEPVNASAWATCPGHRLAHSALLHTHRSTPRAKGRRAARTLVLSLGTSSPRSWGSGGLAGPPQGCRVKSCAVEPAETVFGAGRYPTSPHSPGLTRQAGAVMPNEGLLCPAGQGNRGVTSHWVLVGAPHMPSCRLSPSKPTAGCSPSVSPVVLCTAKDGGLGGGMRMAADSS